MENDVQTLNYDIQALKRKMLVKYPFFGSVIANVEYKESPGLTTCGTDGEKIYYAPKFLNSLDTDEQVFVFAHEVCHIAFNHILRSEGKDQHLWNIATDAVINQFLKRDGLKMPQEGVNIPEAINFDAESYYNKLVEEKKKKEQEQQQQQQQQQGEGQQQGQGQGQGQSGEDQQQQQQGQGGGQSSSDAQQMPQPQQGDGQGQGSGQNEQQQDQQQGQGGGQGDQQSENQDQKDKQSGGGQGQEQNDQQSDKQDGSGSGDQEEQNKDVGHDTHKMWEEAVKRHKEQQEEEQNKDKDKKDKKKDKGKDKDQDKDQDKDKNNDKDKQDNNKPDSNNQDDKNNENNENKKDNLKNDYVDEREQFEKNQEEKKEMLKKLKEQLQNSVSKSAGTTTNSDYLSVGKVGVAKPLIDWRIVLRDAINYELDWSYKNATIENGVLTPHLEEQPHSETEIVLDTSGSIDNNMLKNFLRECKNIFKNSNVKVGCFDTKFYGFEEVRSVEDIDDLNFRGGGGTDFNVAVEAFTNRVENKIIFTDGEASMPRKPVNAIWIVFGDCKINPPGGRVIYIDERQLRKLRFEQDDSYNKVR